VTHLLGCPDRVSVTVTGAASPCSLSRCVRWRRPGTRCRWRISALRDNPECADEEHAGVRGAGDPGLVVALTFDPADDVAAPYVNLGARPKVAILREQGVNSHVETSFAFDRAGFDTYDVHMTDLQAGGSTSRRHRARGVRRLLVRRHARRR
jgi:hypothetical protein